MITDNDIIFAASVVQGADKTRNNIAALDSGFFGSVDNEWLHDEQRKLKNFEQAHVARTKHLREIGREAAAQAESTRLVKGRKSRTTGKHRIDRLNGVLANHTRRSRSVVEVGEQDHVTQSGQLFDVSGLHDNGQSRVYLMQRDWSNEYKVQTVYKPAPSEAPNANDGERYTDNLTPRAVKKIFESGAYVAAVHGGFTTFLTLTFSPELRAQLFKGEITIGSEVSRFLSGAKNCISAALMWLLKVKVLMRYRVALTNAPNAVKVKGKARHFITFAWPNVPLTKTVNLIPMYMYCLIGLCLAGHLLRGQSA